MKHKDERAAQQCPGCVRLTAPGFDVAACSPRDRLDAQRAWHATRLMRCHCAARDQGFMLARSAR
jgi:hypothetical protein